MLRGVTMGDNTHRFLIKPHPLHKSLRFNFRCQSLSSLYISMILATRPGDLYRLFVYIPIDWVGSMLEEIGRFLLSQAVEELGNLST